MYIPQTEEKLMKAIDTLFDIRNVSRRKRYKPHYENDFLDESPFNVHLPNDEIEYAQDVISKLDYVYTRNGNKKQAKITSKALEEINRRLCGY